MSLEETLRYLPLRSRTQFAPSARKWMRADTMWRVPYARVLIADYDLLRRDFSVLQSRSESEIRQWLVEQTGFVSDLQTHPIHNQPTLPGAQGSNNPFHVNSLIPVREPGNWQKFHGAWLADSNSQTALSREELRRKALGTRPRCVPRNGVIPERCSMRPPTYERAVVLPVYLM